MIKRGFNKNYTVWTTYGEIDEPHEVEIEDDKEVGYNVDQGNMNSGGDNQDDQDDDEFDYEELLRHVEPQVLSYMGTHKGLDNMEILENSS